MCCNTTQSHPQSAKQMDPQNWEQIDGDSATTSFAHVRNKSRLTPAHTIIIYNVAFSPSFSACPNDKPALLPYTAALHSIQHGEYGASAFT